MKQTPAMDKAERQYKKEAAESKASGGALPRIAPIARKHRLSVAAFYQARWYKEFKALEKKDGS